jgi:hypothetical protein
MSPDWRRQYTSDEFCNFQWDLGVGYSWSQEVSITLNPFASSAKIGYDWNLAMGRGGYVNYR